MKSKIKILLIIAALLVACTNAKTEKAEEVKLVKEIEAAFKKAEAAKSPAGKTFGELFKAHELPTADGAKSIRE